MIMKKILMTLALALALTTQAAPVTVPADTVDEVEAYSDTTSVDSVAADNSDFWDEFDDDWQQANTYSILSDMGFSGGEVMGVLGTVLAVIGVLFLLFVLAPVALIGIILFFVYKNRKERMRMMELALKSGKQIPLDVLGTPYMRHDDLWNKGIKQMFLGAGLAFLLWVVFGKLGLAIGGLVVLIGAGNMVIANNYRQKQKEKALYDSMFHKSPEADTESEQ